MFRGFWSGGSACEFYSKKNSLKPVLTSKNIKGRLPDNASETITHLTRTGDGNLQLLGGISTDL